ncbi:hypothetical protein AHAS_Ahas14G0111400 [Arachis hypogaea]
MAKNFVFVFTSFMILLISSVQTSSAQLSRGFYNNTCPNVEQLVRAAVTQKLQQTFVTAPSTLRLFFHDCFVRGCDASVLLVSPTNQAEKNHPDDVSLAGDGFDTVVKAKVAVDSDPQCRNKVSCADILALATRDVVNLLNSLFSFNGLSQTDMIALSGGHTIGFSHCNKFSKRMYNFSPRNRIDPTLNLQYALKLKQTCPVNVDPRVALALDPFTPQTFDNQYFKNLQQGMGLLSSDQVLFTDPRSRDMVNLFASNEQAFYTAFVTAITKLGRGGVKTGNQGEIRVDCTKVN